MLLAIMSSYCQSPSPRPEPIPTPAPEFLVETVLEDLTHPVSLNFAPDGRLLILERGQSVDGVETPAKLKIFTLASGKIAEVPGAPEAFAQFDDESINLGGAVGMELDPDFAQNHRLYICYHRQVAPTVFENRLSAFTLEPGGLTQERVIVDHVPGDPIHNGCRVVVGPDDKLYYSTGEAALSSNALDLSSLAGKILRVNRDGSVPEDNPYPDSLVWSSGHRNPQGLGFHPDTGDLWSTEHGDLTNDELNLIEKGMNYGWPECRGEAKLGERFWLRRPDRRKRCRLEPALRDNYRPAVKAYNRKETLAISDLTFYRGDAFPQWNGNLFFVTLKTGQLVRVALDGHSVKQEQRLLTGEGEEFYGRLRDVTVGPDGFIYVVSNADAWGRGHKTGLLLRVRPPKSIDAGI